MGNKPSWRFPKHPPRRPNPTFPGYQSRFGDGHPGRRQCVAIAKATGKRCKKDPLQGSSRCGSHGGHTEAYHNAPKGFISSRTPVAVARAAMARIGWTEPFPENLPWHPSPIQRGKLIEAERNRRLGLTKGLILKV